jgi:hypothetical protein
MALLEFMINVPIDPEKLPPWKKTIGYGCFEPDAGINSSTYCWIIWMLPLCVKYKTYFPPA